MLQRKYMYKYQPYTMSRRNGPPGPAPFNVKYEPLANHDGYIDLQFKRPPPRVPYKAIAMATVLFLLGSLLIVIGACLLTGVIDSKYSDRTWPVLTLGFLLFLPGSYHVRLAWLAWCGRPGYSYADIPDFDD
uniref:transmembrane protein 230 isoform X3 n=1 Tax=Myxine glutinosa TaxID=7769 RepID=UPI00358FFC5C